MRVTVIKRGRATCLNRLYRHGLLLAPALARHAADTIFDPPFGESS